jgi:murein DD-endopeptidase MepM/ murein hydrolase activator NlpD
MDLLPLITPIHIVRHGLRKRVLSTRFARASLNVVNNITPVNVTTPAAAEAATPDVAAVAAEAPLPAPSPAVLPVELVEGEDGYTQGYVAGAVNQWRYRPKTFDGRRHINNIARNPVPANGVKYWRFHNGVDIAGRRGTPIKAVADGEVVMAAPVGTNGRDSYGNVVVIYHPAQEIYSLYAHLDTIAPPFVRVSRSRNLAQFASPRIVSGGTYTPVAVRAGDVIGTMGNTDCEGVHLHFEFNVVRNGKAYPASLDRNRGLIPDVFVNEADAPPGYRSSRSRPTEIDESKTISQNPIRVFRELFGLTLPVGRNIIEGALPDEEVDDAATFPGDEGENANLVPLRPIPPEPTEAPEPGATPPPPATTGHIDHSSTRRLLARWTLMQDHWYQHNLEYVSGTITMRGAPEIRVGYRLDLPDRNCSYYIEGVSHNWTYGQPMTTTLHVTRGQPNNPHPVYVLPALKGFNATDTQRKVSSRLSTYFIVPDPQSVRRSIKTQRTPENMALANIMGVAGRSSPFFNEVDTSGDANSVSARYNEKIVESVMGSSDPTFEDQMRAIQADLDSALARSLPGVDEALGSLRQAANTTTGVTTNPASAAESANLAAEFNFLTSPGGVR